MKNYLIFILIILALSACSGPRGDAAGIINSERISYSDFIRSYQGHTANFQVANGRMPNSEEKNAIFNETWRNIITHVILKDAFEKYQVSVTEQEVIDTLLVSIPSYLKNSPSLMINGKFNHELYYQSVRYDSPFNMSPVRRNYYEYYVPVQKLKEKLIDEQLNNGRNTKQITEIAVSKADFDLIVFDPLAMEPVISDTEIESYYNRNLEQFVMDPIYSIEYISLPVSPNEIDQQYTEAVTDTIHTQVIAGKSFETIINEKQEQIPGLSLSEPGFVRIENIDPDTLPILERLQDNSFSRPIPIGSGFAIYQKLQRSKSMLSYRALQIPPIISPSTVNAYYAQARGAMNLAQETSMSVAASELELKLAQHNNLSVKDLWYTDKLVVDYVVSNLMTHKKGDILEPTYSNITGNWLIIRLSENQVNRVHPLAEVKHQITPILIASRQQMLAQQMALQWLQENPSLNPDPERDRFESYSQAGIDSKYAKKELDLIYLNAMQRYLQKQKPQVDRLDDLFVILIPKAYYPSNSNEIDRSLLKGIYTRQLPENWFETWVKEKEQKARIRIFVTP